MNLNLGFMVWILGQPYTACFPCNIYRILQVFQNIVSHIKETAMLTFQSAKGQMESTITSEKEND